MQYSEKLKNPKWQRKRLEIMQRDNFQCQCCFDRDKTLVVHHKVYIRGCQPWEYDNDNLITFCEGCHEEFHLFESRVSKYPERILQMPDYTNLTDMKILQDRIDRIVKLEQDFAIKSITQLLTSYTIKLEDL